MKVWNSEQWSNATRRQALARDAFWEGPVPAILLFLLQWRKINICLTVADHWEIEWISSGSQISPFVFLLLAQRLDPEADVPPRHGPSGWRVQAKLRVGVRVKFRGRRSDEGQGYGRAEVMVRSKYPAPLGQHLSGYCLPQCPVREMSSTMLQLIRNLLHCVCEIWGIFSSVFKVYWFLP